MKSLEELKKLQEQAKQGLVLRERNVDIKVTVSMGECGYNAGARTILITFLNGVAKRKLPNIIVVQSDCLGYCEYEPVVKVVEKSGRTTIYKNVSIDDVNKIIEQHLINGSVVLNKAIDAIRE